MTIGISIVVTREDGTTFTIATNTDTKAVPGTRAWHAKPDFENFQKMTRDEEWAASFLCAEMAMRFLPPAAGNIRHMEAVVAYNASSRFWPERQSHPDASTGKIFSNDLGDAMLCSGLTPKK